MGTRDIVRTEVLTLDDEHDGGVEAADAATLAKQINAERR
jgi:hypothetical protein